MAAPLQRGRRLALQRLLGLLFLGVLVGLVLLTVALYQKAFQPVVLVTVQADRVGNQLSKGADVKARGLLVGEVRDVSSDGGLATLTLALDEQAAAQLPSDARARMIPKTLFGEKIVDLVLDDASTARPLRSGDTIPQDRTETARETSQALDNLLPLLQTLRPAELSTTLNALSSALRGSGERLGENLELVDTYLQGINPEVATLGRDAAGLADLGDTLTRATPDLVTVLDNSAFLSRSLVDQQDELTAVLTTTTGAGRELTSFLQDNEDRLIRLAADSLPSLQVFARYSPQFPCLAAGLAEANQKIGDSFGGLQPGLHITLELVDQQGGYRPGDEPVYGEDAGPTCYGLPPNPPIQPFPVYTEVTDGYCDDQERRKPGVQTECEGRETGPLSGPLPERDTDRAAVGAIVGRVMGVAPQEVPDAAVLLFGPVARGNEVGLR